MRLYLQLLILMSATTAAGAGYINHLVLARANAMLRVLYFLMVLVAATANGLVWTILLILLDERGFIGLPGPIKEFLPTIMAIIFTYSVIRIVTFFSFQLNPDAWDEFAYLREEKIRRLNELYQKLLEQKKEDKS